MSRNGMTAGVANTLLANASSECVTNDAADAFIDEIQVERRRGYGFLPLVGAGFSAPSGVPLINEIATYLNRCIAMAMGAASEEPPLRPWNPRTDQWPTFVDREEGQPAPDWKAKVRQLLQSRESERSRRGYDAADEELPVLREALGAMEEWRTSLLFLSRLTRDAAGACMQPEGVAALDAPQPEIIDACFREALKDKSPTLGHRMLAVLAGAMRFDLLLTTNFDNLLERGFAASRNTLEVCEVPLGGHLPQWASVSDVRTLIKLHGNRRALRADYSLDASPSELDRQRFLEYLRLQKDACEASPLPLSGGLGFRNQLLVLGHSAGERRTRALIEHAWRHLNEQFRVFWLCHSQRDVERIQAFTRNFALAQGKPADWCGSCVLRYPDPGMFLLHLFQRIRRNLPAHTGLFPSVSRLSSPPLKSAHSRIRSELQQQQPAVAEFKATLTHHLAHIRKMPVEYRFVVATSATQVHGVTTACADIFRRLEEGIDGERFTCLWIDMNDVSSADNLFETLLEAAYFRLGHENWTPCYIASDRNRPRAREIRRLVNSFNYPCVVFLNARETPGANTARPPESTFPHGWLDSPRPEEANPKRSDYAEAFFRLIKELCSPLDDTLASQPAMPGRGISIALLCRELAADSPLARGIQNVGGLIAALRESSGDHDDQRVVADSIKWAGRDAARQRFLHALILMQRPRPLATIWTPAVSAATDAVTADADLLKWLCDLEEHGLIRRKAGGYIWIHCRCRELTRATLRSRAQMEALLPGSGEHWQARQDEPQLHSLLADWYARVFDSSSTPPAAFEVIYHQCRAAHTRLELLADTAAVRWAAERVVAACSFLRTHRFIIQTRGYSRESCRRLEHIRDTLCPAIRQSESAATVDLNRQVQRLAIICTEIMRAIAREVGEDSKAYQRHRELALYHIDATGKLAAAEEARANGSGTSRLSARLHDALTGGLVPWLQWLRWWRWMGMLGIASRSFHSAERSLRRALQLAITRSGEYRFEHEQIDWSRLPDCQFPRQEFSQGEPGRARLQELRIEVLRAAEQFVTLQLLRDGVRHRLGNQPALGDTEFQHRPDATQDAASPLARISEIEQQIAASLQLAAAIRENDDSPGSYDTVSAVWCQSRLIMHLSVCKMRRLQSGDSGRHQIPQTAMALLGDAEVCLRVANPQRHRSDLALVDLYRGEARLRLAECMQVSWGERAPPLMLAVMCRKLEQWEPGEFRKENREALYRRFPWLQMPPENLGRMRAQVGDAMRFLNRAEPVLRERRRNVWWTTWFFERKLRTIALSVWLSVFELRAPIPYLGFEAAASGLDTAADGLLDIGIRMIRVDAYRLATIIDAYASCAKALQVRLWLDAAGNPMMHHERQGRMRKNLLNALDQLEKVLQARQEAGGEQRSVKTRMDEDVLQLVTRIAQRCDWIVRDHLQVNRL